MPDVFFGSPAIDTNIIEIYNHKFADEGAQDIVHHAHKRGWGVAEPKTQDCPLKQAHLRPECSLMDISLLHFDLVIPRGKVNLREILGTMQLVQ